MEDRVSKIYRIINKINNTQYIGYTINSIEYRFEEHLYRCFKLNYVSKLYNSMRKYGKDNFYCELIEECDPSLMFEKEKEYIKKFNTYNSGLNSTLGGEGCLGYTHSFEIRNKISENLKLGNSHKGKTYEVIYGDNSDIEKKKRSSSVKKSWENMSEDKKLLRKDNIRIKTQMNSKYGVELIKEIKGKIKEGMNIKEFKLLYPNVRKNLFYEIKNGYRWNKI